MIDKIVFDYERTELENGISALKIPRQKFDSYKEIDHLLRYITRTRDNENEYNDLISYGVRGATSDCGISGTIEQWKQIQKMYRYPGSRGNRRYFGRHCFHEIYCLNQDISEKIVRDRADELAYKLSEEYCQKGHQVVYGVHAPDRHEGRLHIHFAVNTICLKTGKKWHDWHDESKKRKQRFDGITIKFLRSY